MTMSIRTAAACLLLFVLVRTVSSTVADPDLWGHVRFGQDILASRTIPEVDPYSFTSDRPWVNHEWLAEVVMAGAYNGSGALGLSALKIASILAVAVFVAASVRRASSRATTRYFLVALAVLLTYPRMQTVRPQLFSVVAFAALLFLLQRASDGARRWVYFIPLLMALWANVHGGFLVGALVLFAWCTVEIARRWKDKRTVAAWLACGTAAAVATLINPYGVRLWEFVWATVGMRQDIPEWWPIVRVETAVFIMWSISALAALTVLSRPKCSAPVTHLVTVAVLGVLSAFVSRLDAFFALTVFVLLAPQIASRLDRGKQPEGAQMSWHQPAVLVTVGVLALVSSTHQLQCISIREPISPEANAVRFLSAGGLHGRVLTLFEWGEYAIWYLTPGMRISFDGRRETVYSQAQIDSNMELYRNSPTGVRYAASLRPDYIWLPKSLPVVSSLRSDGWIPIYTGELSTILARQESHVRFVPAAEPVERCFPGP